MAIEDVKTGGAFSRQFASLPEGVEKQMIAEYEEMLWRLMERASEATHSSLEPMFSTIDPNLPTLNTLPIGREGEDDTAGERVSEEYLASRVLNWASTLLVSGDEAKEKMRAPHKQEFLSPRRACFHDYR